MKKIFCVLLCFCIFTTFFTSCENREISMEKFEQLVSIYKNKIQSIDETLMIHESVLVTQMGDHIVIYSIETPTGAYFCVDLTLVSHKMGKLEINYYYTRENWSADNTQLYASLIAELTNYELSYEEVKNAVESMEKSDYYRFSRKSNLSWSEDRLLLFYSETFSPDKSGMGHLIVTE